MSGFVLLFLLFGSPVIFKSCSKKMDFKEGHCYSYETGHFNKKEQIIKITRIEGDDVEFLYFSKEFGDFLNNYPKESNIEYGSVSIFKNEVNCPIPSIN